MSKYIPPHLRNDEQNTNKHVHFQQDRTARPKVKSYEEHSTPASFGYRQQKEEILESDNAALRKEVAASRKENIALRKENAALRNEAEELRNEAEELNKRVSRLSEDVALYRGDREECIPKSWFNELNDKFEEAVRRKQEYSRKLKEINDVHRNDTDSLRTEINILKEELKKSEKKITHLSSNMTSLSQTNEQLKQTIESFNSSQNLIEEPKKEENSELIPDDWHNIKTSLKYLLNDQKLRKQFIKDTGINLAGMKLTVEIIEKLGL